MQSLFCFIRFSMLSLVLAVAINMQPANAQGFAGYYQNPAIHDQMIYFAAEGDLWSVPLEGGLAQRLTTHPGEEGHPEISPDGSLLAFTATYEGPPELFVMPVQGGLPARLTFDAESNTVNTWTPSGEVVFATSAYATLPDLQLVRLNPTTFERTRVPLSQASEASYSDDGQVVFFVRPAFHRNVTKRYQGGTARQIWKFATGDTEATKLTTDYAGESHHPMWWNGRVYFITDRDGYMNIWSMLDDGSDLMQHTRNSHFDVRDAGLHNGQIVYQYGADLWHLDLTTNTDRRIDIRLASDLDQLRQKWVDNPTNYITSVHLHPTGDHIVITARGRVFVAPAGDGRFVQLSRKEGVRYRDAVFSSDGEDVIVLSDESGEFEFVRIPAHGIGDHTPLTDDGKILRFTGIPSPDGQWLAYEDLNRDLWVLDIASGTQQKISTNQEGIGTYRWSPDSKWLAFTQDALNTMAQIHLYEIATGQRIVLTSDRANSQYPTWSPDGEWIYFLSDRNFQSLVGSPWGARQPEPYFDRQWKLYHVPLKSGLRSPFRPDDELVVSDDEDNEKDEGVVSVEAEGIQQRLSEVPVPPGNYRTLSMNDKGLYWLSRETGLNARTHLMGLKTDNDDPKPETLLENVQSYELSQDGKKLLIRQNRNLYVVAAGTSALKNIADHKVDLSDWTFPLDVREDWRQLYTDAWRMERDYFYDPDMHGVDWQGMYQKYLPLVDRVTTRNELSDVIGRFVGELSALHTSVRGGDVRRGEDNVQVANLGARLSRSETQGGYVIEKIYQADPDYPDQRSPLDDPYLDIQAGDVITHVNGVDVLSQTDIGALLRNQQGKQVRIGIREGGAARDVIVTPIGNARNLRYSDWEYSRRQMTESLGSGKIGYVHLRAMGSRDLAQWYREFYPVFNRQGLIIDVRHNRGGNIESFILEKLLRKDWMYWKGRTGEPYWNMQYAFRGHIVVLVDENTASDGEAFADGFRRLGLGVTIGTRTWGGEIWLSGANRLSDGGIARAPMFGVYGPEGEWLIEGHGFEPDIVVDNLPHATFNGHDAQLQAAVTHLLQAIEIDPRRVPPPPPYPDKSFRD